MTDIFPPFSSASIAGDYLRHFTINEFRESTVANPEVVVSTSLYWGICYLHEKLPPLDLATLFTRMADRKKATWWRTYMAPLLSGCSQVLPPRWQRRIYLAGNLAFLKDAFPPQVQVVVMSEDSPTSIPGMLWRYLPLMEPVFCVARGADNFHLPERYIRQVQDAITIGAQLVRITLEMDLAYQNKFHYRTICGSCATRGPLPFLENATSWIKANKEVPETLTKTFRGLEHTAMYRWDAFGQDEQFLCRWLYHTIVQRKDTIITDPHPNRYGELFKKDCAFLEDSGVKQHIIF